MPSSIQKSWSSFRETYRACHHPVIPQNSTDDSLKNGFSLTDGRLTLDQLVRLHMPHAQVAYLSAHESTAADENQPDETESSDDDAVR
jgi:hypothetical protein